MKRKSIALILLGLIVSSCNLPASKSSNPQIATAAALTVQAALNDTSNITPLASTVYTDSPMSGETTPTFSNSKPSASFGEVVNCRTGPGTDYERVIQIFPNETIDIIGFYPPNYWVVNSKAGICWTSGQYTTPSGNFTTIPTVTAPPTPKGGVPSSVSLQKWDILCDYQTGAANVTIRWTDKENEVGYRITRNSDIIAELPANSTEFKETISLLSGQSAAYSVIAFNSIGSTSSSAIKLNC